MKAVALHRYLPSTDPESLLDVDIPAPEPLGHDLLVRVRAVSVNPVDTKVRSPKDRVEAAPRVLGWDAAGVVERAGSEVTLFEPGDAVYFAGSITRAGSNSELCAVDERIVGPMPRSLDFAEAAALPLTAITAYEGLFERLGVDPGGRHAGRTLLVIGGAGGVGTVTLQLAKIAGLRVVATASRPESRAACERFGADLVIDHREPLAKGLSAHGLTGVDFIFNTVDTASYWSQMVEIVAPQGKIVGIVETSTPLELGALMRKSATFAWELMFTRAIFQTPDMIAQHELLAQVAAWVDAGRIKTTLTERLSPINAANLRAAHQKLESATMIGKLVIEGW